MARGGEACLPALVSQVANVGKQETGIHSQAIYVAWVRYNTSNAVVVFDFVPFLLLRLLLLLSPFVYHVVVCFGLIRSLLFFVKKNLGVGAQLFINWLASHIQHGQCHAIKLLRQ